MGFYPPDSLVQEAQTAGIRSCRPTSTPAGSSATAETVETATTGPGVRIGLAYIKGANEKEMEELVAERDRGGAYAGLADLAAPARVPV